jgi:hypothetical protein
MYRRLFQTAGAVLLVAVAAFSVGAQSRGGFGGGGGGGFGTFTQAGWANGRHQREMVPSKRQGFYGCWLMFETRARIDGAKRGWETDYPLAVRNFMTRVGDFTTATINTYPDGAMADGVVRPTDEGIFQCPLLFSSDIGTAVFSKDEAEGLRNYLLKGGLLWVDDFWGRDAMAHWETQLEQILPGYQRIALSKDHPLMSTFYFLEAVPQMPSIQAWQRSGGLTYEQRGRDSSVPDISAIVDDHGRVMVVMTHNTDIGDGMEREGVDPNYFFLFSPPAYAMSINIAVYSMTR